MLVSGNLLGTVWLTFKTKPVRAKKGMMLNSRSQTFSLLSSLKGRKEACREGGEDERRARMSCARYRRQGEVLDYGAASHV